MHEHTEDVRLDGAAREDDARPWERTGDATRPWDRPGGAADATVETAAAIVRPPPVPKPSGTRFDDFPGVSNVKRAGVVAALVVFGATVLVPVLAIAWAALVLAAIAAAGAALLHTGGLEPSTFGTAMAIGLLFAAALLAFVVLAPRPPSVADVDSEIVDLDRWSTRHPLWSRHPALLATLGLVALAGAATLAGATRSPFFPYPWATIILVAAVAFVAVVSLGAAYLVLRAIGRAIYRWACVASYRAGIVTAACVLLGLAGGWAAYEGWTARPAQLVAGELQLDAIAPPASAAEAGAMALCLGAGEVDWLRAAGDDAPSCGFLVEEPAWPW